ncbi:argininosuccinate lyase [Pasteurella testudinis DSM 23072]|uniref:argininosuccinate lyase n=1 Tax=Pasteurella testudinis DSM 23072 TaxID=1122938 RepID=A0A1W1USB3_9PAST|nr:lyase family protein [Pasteurella testudinis]SMB83926.1 argininosuccinate lyase [Pasteurella testudinis DSM 23072]SUB50945.1 argininosuccinate lyase [Pasteurella testudinis]
MFNHDSFYWINQIEKASTLMTFQEGIVTKAVAQKVAAALQQLSAGSHRPHDYYDVQPMLLELTGSEGSMTHVGRSWQDIQATLQRLLIRDRVFYLYYLSLETRKRLLNIAGDHLDTIVPSYTYGVQAQPVTLGHLFLGYEATLARSGNRLSAYFVRLNKCPLGAAALATSSFPINRAALADFLGFEGYVENAFDAAQLSLIDVGVEGAYIASLLALSIGTLIQDLHIQFHHTRPWLLLEQDSLNSPSTLMPQKRNPSSLDKARLLASQVSGDAFRASISAHNVNSGLTDYKNLDVPDTLERACLMLKSVNLVLDGLQVDKEAALQQVNADYSTTTELANLLQRKAAIPFNIAHEFASRLSKYGKLHKLTPQQLPFETAVSLFDEVIAKNLPSKVAFPLSQTEFFSSLEPANMINSHLALGGTNPAEVQRILAKVTADLQQHESWLYQTQDNLKKSDERLTEMFNDLVER